MRPSLALPAVSRSQVWSGRVLSGIAVLFLLFDAVIKLLKIAPVEESFLRLGYATSIAPAIGLLELVCLAAYVVPRTAALGALLLTGFLGGAIAIHVRVADPLLSHVLFPGYVGALIWGGLLLRDRRLRDLVPSLARDVDSAEAGSTRG